MRLPQRQSVGNAALAALMALCCGCEGTTAANDGPGGGPPPARVEVGHARAGEVTVTWTFLGEVRPRHRAELAAGEDGEVLSVEVREGDVVEEGALLLTIDNSLARAQLRAVRAQSAQTAEQSQQARREAERFDRAGSRLVAGVEIERAQSEATALEAQTQSLAAEVARVRATLRRHEVRAPFRGVIAARAVDPGDWVAPGTPALEIVGDQDVEILVQVQRQVLPHVAVGDTATLASGDDSMSAEIVGVVRALDPRTRTATVRLAPAEVVPWLLAGATVDVSIEAAIGADGAVVVPRDAVVDGVVEDRVVTVVDGKAAPVRVEVLERGTEEILVRGEGLEAGATVVTRGNERLRPEQALQVVAPQADERSEAGTEGS